MVVCHLESGPAKTTLDVEALVNFAAVEDGLVAADVLRNVVKGLNHSQSKLLALLVLGDGDIFDVSNSAEGVNAG